MIVRYSKFTLLTQIFEAEKYFFQLTAEILRSAYTRVSSCRCVWSVEVSTGKWEEYSYEVNGQIEDAQSKNLSHVCCSLLFTHIYFMCLRLNS